MSSSTTSSTSPSMNPRSAPTRRSPINRSSQISLRTTWTPWTQSATQTTSPLPERAPVTRISPPVSRRSASYPEIFQKTISKILLTLVSMIPSQRRKTMRLSPLGSKLNWCLTENSLKTIIGTHWSKFAKALALHAQHPVVSHSLTFTPNSASSPSWTENFSPHSRKISTALPGNEFTRSETSLSSSRNMTFLTTLFRRHSYPSLNPRRQPVISP